MDSELEDPERAARSRTTLSTGHAVSLPLELEFAMGGVVVPARRTQLEAILPSGLSALAVAPGVGCVALVGIQYHRVGGRRDGDGLEPYDEFAVVVPAVRGGRTRVPFRRLLDGELGGYVHWLPVTTEASVALGREIWGYPKELADVTVTDGPRGIRTVVRRDGDGDDGDEVVRLEVPRPRLRSGARRELTLRSYSVTDGELRESEARIRGRIALASPLGTTLAVDSDLASEVGLWRRPLAELYGRRVRAQLTAGAPVDRGDVTPNGEATRQPD